MRNMRKGCFALAAAAWSLLAGCAGDVSTGEGAEGSNLKVGSQTQNLDGIGSRGQEFWLAFPGNYQTNPDLTLFVTGDTATTGQVTIPGLSFTANFTVTPGTVTPVTVPATAQQVSLDGVESRAIHVTAGADISIYGLNRIQFTTDAFLGLPTNSLGTDYIVQAFPNTNIVNGSQFSVVATEDATVVTITPSQTFGSRPAGVPFNVSLNRGQTYQLRSTAAAPSDVSGTIVTSNRPVAVFGGHQCANVPNGNTTACDYLVEQLPPTTTWGKSFVTMPLATRVGGDTFRFVASTNGTQVSVNGSVVATLNRGQVHQRIISGAATITSTQPIMVAQYSNGSSYDGVTSDPFMMLIPPYEQFPTNYTVTTPASGFITNFINVVVPTAAIGQVTLDGAVIAANRFTAIGSSGFSGAQLAVNLGTHRLAANLPFGAFMYGFDSYDSYGYPGGMALAEVAEVTTVTLAPKTGSAQVNTQHCVTATVLDQDNEPLEGIRVDFAVTGANAVAGQDNTTAAGLATFCYTGTAGGADAIVASVGTLSDNATFTWLVNTPPSVNAGPDLTGYTGETLTLNGSGTDPDGDALTYAWSYTGTSGVTCTFGAPNSAVSSFSCSGTGTFTVTLTANDGRGGTASDSAIVTLGEPFHFVMCGMPRYTNQTSVKGCGYITPGASGAAIASVFFTVDGGAPIPVTPDFSGGFVITWFNLTEGTHVVRLTATDTLGNVFWREQTVTADYTAPTISVVSPTPSDVNPTPVVTITYAEQDASPVTVQTQWGVTTDVPAGSNTISHTVDLVNWGWNNVIVRATDAAGNTTEQVFALFIGT